MDILSDWYNSLGDAVNPEDGRITWLGRRLAVPGLEPVTASEILHVVPREKIIRPGRGPERLHMFGLPILREKSGFALWEAELSSAVAGVLTFATGRRIETFEEMALKPKEGDVFFSPVVQLIDKRLDAPIDDGVDLAQSFRNIVLKLVKLEEKERLAVTAALQLHYGACILAPSSPTTAYTSVVAGIETLSRKFGSPPSDWFEWDLAATWDKFAREAGLTEDQHLSLRAKLMKDRQIRLKETFSRYASSRLPESFYDEVYVDWTYVGDGVGGWQNGFEAWREPFSNFVPRDREDLRQSLKRSYDLRSEFVHTGRSSITFLTPGIPYDLGTSRGMTNESRYKSGDPLSFAMLRSVLVALIRAELNSAPVG
ncbi:hypothetical protein [Amycolatopsis sp. NPDC051716]|uniref:hypothetical protein n=1 Tax=Amycolatopsis sp. NPDC051716 TaxID=3155804 RepID=UPI00342622F7